MKYKKYVVSTITLARTNEEEKRIFQSLQVLSAKNFSSIIAVDGGSSKNFIEELKKIPNIHITQTTEKGIQPQVMESLQKAGHTNLPYIFYTESDKIRFFENGLDEFITKGTEIAERDQNFGLIVPGRNKKSFSTFPAFQQFTESTVNNLINRLTNQDEDKDYLYGPKIVAKSLIPYLDKVKEDIGWGWMCYLAIIGHRLGKNNYTVSLNLQTSVENEMEDESEIKLRLKQMKDHINGIYLALAIQL